MLLALGLITVASKPIVKFATGIAGGVALLIFGAFQIRRSFKSEFDERISKELGTRDLLLVGLAFTGLNPFFIAWWLTVGSNLILISFELTSSLAGVVLMYVCHVWIDYAWLILVAQSAKTGISIVGSRWYKVLSALFGAILIYFGFIFLRDSLNF
jgi:threonine/homoserine/homoserine lactone efflux protein